MRPFLHGQEVHATPVTSAVCTQCSVKLEMPMALCVSDSEHSRMDVVGPLETVRSWIQ